MILGSFVVASHGEGPGKEKEKGEPLHPSATFELAHRLCEEVEACRWG